MKFTMIFFYVLIMLCPLTQAADTEEMGRMASRRWHEWRKGQKTYPLAAWGYFSRSKNDGSTEEFQRYAQAGLTIISVSERQYDKATKAGLQVIIGGWQKLYKDKGKLQSVIVFNNSHAAVTGFQLTDEPHPDLFETLGEAMETIYHQDRNLTLPIIDMLPNWAWQLKLNRRVEKFGLNYDAFMRKYIQTVHPPVLLNCCYPPLKDGTDRPEFYANLETFRKYTLANDIGLMGFVLINDHMWYRRPSESDIRWQVYSCAAYGCQGIWYYNWRIRPNDKFGQGMVIYDTLEPTQEFHVVREVNCELCALSAVLMKLKSVNVYLTGNIVPPGTMCYPDEGIPGSCSIERFGVNNFIIGEFINQDDPADESAYIMLVNKRHGAGLSSGDASLAAEAVFRPTVNFKSVSQYRASDGSLKKLQPVRVDGEEGYYRLKVPGGQGVLLKFSKD